MLNNSIAEEWHSFQEHCCRNFNAQQIVNAQHIFYAAFHAAILMVLALPHTHAGDEVGIMNALRNLSAEGDDYWLAAKQSVSKAEEQPGDPF